jgi:hypothetical protein
VGFRHNEKRLLTLFLDTLKLRKLHGLVKNAATVDAYGYAIHISFGVLAMGVPMLYEYHHIGVGFCVARSTVMGNPGPRIVGRVTVRIPRFSYLKILSDRLL